MQSLDDLIKEAGGDYGYKIVQEKYKDDPDTLNKIIKFLVHYIAFRAFMIEGLARYYSACDCLVDNFDVFDFEVLEKTLIKDDNIKDIVKNCVLFYPVADDKVKAHLKRDEVILDRLFGHHNEEEEEND